MLFFCLKRLLVVVDVVPTEPQQFTVDVVASKQVTVKWTSPALRCENNSCTYQLHYWRVNITDRQTPLDGPEATTIKVITVFIYYD